MTRDRRGRADRTRPDRRLQAGDQVPRDTGTPLAADQVEPELPPDLESDLLVRPRPGPDTGNTLSRDETSSWRLRLLEALRRECHSGTHTVEFRQDM